MCGILKMLGLAAREPDIAKLKRKGKVDQLIKALSYSSPYPVPGQNVNEYTRKLAHKKSIALQVSAAKALAEMGGGSSRSTND